ASRASTYSRRSAADCFLSAPPPSSPRLHRMAEARKIAIVGGGRIGEALLSGLLSSGWRTPDEIVVTARREERVAELHERYAVEATTSNPTAVRDAGLVVVAVKP